MCREGQPDRSVTLYEGHIRCLLELDTPIERLAALETVFAIAFPKDEDKSYIPPEIPTNGDRLSPEDKARRLAYNIFNGLIRYQGKKGESRLKDQKKVGAGKRGAFVRWGDSSSVERYGESSDVGDSKVDGNATTRNPPSGIPQAVWEDDFSNANEAGNFRKKRGLTEEQKRIVEEWDKKIPNAEAHYDYLDKNYLNSTRPIAVTKGFCEYAFQRLSKEDRWISTRDGRPFRNISTAIHWLALGYQKQLGEMKRMEEEEHRLDLESAYHLKNAEIAKMSSTEIADLERRRRRKAEKDTVEKIMRGEL